MLVLSRKPGENILIGTDIVITLVEVVGNRVKIGIDAPAEVAILRGELRNGMEAPHSSRARSTSSQKTQDLVESV